MRRGGFLACVCTRAPMLGFVNDTRDRALGAGLVERFSAPLLTVFGDHRAPYMLLPDNCGIIWGTLFTRDGTRVEGIAPETARTWAASAGRLLVDTHWGAYLALFVGRDSVIVMRDPSGALPCYYFVTEKADTVLASDTDHARLAGRAGHAVAWDEVLAQLQYISLRTARTALQGCTELLAGEALELRSRGKRLIPIWSPHAHIGDWTNPPSLAAAKKRLAPVIQRSVAALAAGHNKVIAELSGGIDSSIVTAALARAGADITCLTFKGGAADLDEGRYARAVSQRWRLPLREEALKLDRIDIRRSAAAHLPRPSGRSFSQANDLQALALARTIGADAFFVGTGGDNVLWYFNTVAPALDRLRFEGELGFLKTLSDLATMCDVSWTAALRIGIRKRRQRIPQPWPHDLRFLAREHDAYLQPYHHPWLAGEVPMSPGIRAYVRALILMQDHLDYHARSDHGPVIAPLLAQPVVETCIGIPSWLWCRGGTNRAVARAAFEADLPASVLQRRSKGSFDGFACELFERSRTELRSMLLDGGLARERLLDRSAIEQAFANPQPVDGEVASRLLRLGAVEAWLAALPAG